MSVEERVKFLERKIKSPHLSWQCSLLGLSRSSCYYKARPTNPKDILLMNLIDEQYTKTPFYGSRKIVVYLNQLGHGVNRKRVQRLMRQMGIAGICPGPNTKQAQSVTQGLSLFVKGFKD